MITEAECGEMVIGWAKHNLFCATDKLRRYIASEDGRKAAELSWADMNPDDGVGGMSGNPYQRIMYKDKDSELERLKEEESRANAVFNFIVTRVCRELSQDITPSMPPVEHDGLYGFRGYLSRTISG